MQWSLVVPRVYDKARVGGKARVCDNTEVCGLSLVCGDVDVLDHAQIHGAAHVFDRAMIGGGAEVFGSAWVFGNAEITGDAKVESIEDYIVFKNWWSSGRYFTWTSSNNMWKVGCFYGTGEELIKKAYADSEISGKEYERVVKYVEEIRKS